MLKREKESGTEDNTIQLPNEQTPPLGPVAPLFATGAKTAPKPEAPTEAEQTEAASAQTKPPLVIDWNQYQVSAEPQDPAPPVPEDQPTEDTAAPEPYAPWEQVYQQAPSLTASPIELSGEPASTAVEPTAFWQGMTDELAETIASVKPDLPIQAPAGQIPVFEPIAPTPEPAAPQATTEKPTVAPVPEPQAQAPVSTVAGWDDVELTPADLAAMAPKPQPTAGQTEQLQEVSSIIDLVGNNKAGSIVEADEWIMQDPVMLAAPQDCPPPLPPTTANGETFEPISFNFASSGETAAAAPIPEPVAAQPVDYSTYDEVQEPTQPVADQSVKNTGSFWDAVLGSSAAATTPEPGSDQPAVRQDAGSIPEATAETLAFESDLTNETEENALPQETAEVTAEQTAALELDVQETAEIEQPEPAYSAPEPVWQSVSTGPESPTLGEGHQPQWTSEAQTETVVEAVAPEPEFPPTNDTQAEEASDATVAWGESPQPNGHVELASTEASDTPAEQQSEPVYEPSSEVAESAEPPTIWERVEFPTALFSTDSPTTNNPDPADDPQSRPESPKTDSGWSLASDWSEETPQSPVAPTFGAHTEAPPQVPVAELETPAPVSDPVFESAQPEPAFQAATEDQAPINHVSDPWSESGQPEPAFHAATEDQAPINHVSDPWSEGDQPEPVSEDTTAETLNDIPPTAEDIFKTGQSGSFDPIEARESATPEPERKLSTPAELLRAMSQDPTEIPKGELVPTRYRLTESDDFVDQEAKDKRLGDLLVDHRLITSAQLTRALDRQAETKERLGQILVAMQAITERRLLQVLAAQKGVSPWHLEDDNPSQEALSHVTKETCKVFQGIPVAVRGTMLLVAMRDPRDQEAIDAFAQESNLKIEPMLADEARLAYNIDKAYSIAEARQLAQKDKVVAEALQAVEELRSQPASTWASEGSAAKARPVVGLVNQLIEDGIRMRASDLHIEPHMDTIHIRYRLDGRLVTTRDLPVELADMITARIKTMANLDLGDRANPAEGRISAQFGATIVDLRVSIMPNMHGARIALRILDKAVGLKKIESVGFSERNEEAFRSIIHRPHGLILVTGPTGAGKTTTLYSAIGSLRDDALNIMTVEDPVEYEIDGVNQFQVNEKIGQTFSAQLRAILRQDPDVILVGEIRDRDTAETAIRAALTGHLVLSTLHCNDAVGVVARMAEMEVDPYLLSSAMVATMGQRLVRVLCPDCKERRAPTPQEAWTLKTHFGSEGVQEICSPVGCEKCFGTGYRGRTAVHEIVPVTDEVRHLIAERARSEAIHEAAKGYGFVTMSQDAVGRVLSGETSLDEIRRVLGVSTAGLPAA